MRTCYLCGSTSQMCEFPRINGSMRKPYGKPDYCSDCWGVDGAGVRTEAQRAVRLSEMRQVMAQLSLKQKRARLRDHVPGQLDMLFQPHQVL